MQKSLKAVGAGHACPGGLFGWWLERSGAGAVGGGPGRLPLAGGLQQLVVIAVGTLAVGAERP